MKGTSDLKDTAEILRRGTAIDLAIAAARRDVVERHRRLGLPLVIWRDGQVIEVSSECPLPESDDKRETQPNQEGVNP